MTDDELDRRLAAWGDRERAALPPVPAPRAIPARRGWLAPLAAAAAVVLLVAGVSVLGSGPDDAPAPVAAPSPSAAAGVVPYADLPYVDRPVVEVSPSPLPTAPACTAQQLAARLGEASGATGGQAVAIELRNTSARSCAALVDAKEARGLQAGRRTALPLASVKGNYGPAPVLKPGAVAYAELSWYYRCDDGLPRQAPLTDVQLMVQGEDLPVAPSAEVTRLDLECVDVIRIQPAHVRATDSPTPDPLRGLVITLNTPASVRAGELLRYTVRLSNPTRSAIPLTPCPSYAQAGPDKRVNQLNCAAAPPAVPAGGAVDFAMELPVSPDEPVGSTVLAWFFAGGLGGKGSTSITVVNDSPPPVRCTPAEHVLPCVAGMQDGVSYGTTVDSHCGLGKGSWPTVDCGVRTAAPSTTEPATRPRDGVTPSTRAP